MVGVTARRRLKLLQPKKVRGRTSLQGNDPRWIPILHSVAERQLAVATRQSALVQLGTASTYTARVGGGYQFSAGRVMGPF